jgi:hypothetical protein
MFLILWGGSYPRSTTAGKDGLMRRPPAGNVLCVGNRQGSVWTTGQDRGGDWPGDLAWNREGRVAVIPQRAS